MSASCVFCEIVKRAAPAHVVYEDESTVAFVDLRQFHPGHVLVIPREHLRDVRELDPATGAALIQALSKLTTAVGRAFPNEGMSVRHPVGPAASQEVPHLHFHVHPRRVDDNFLRVYPAEPPPPDPQTLDLYAATVRAALNLPSSMKSR